MKSPVTTTLVLTTIMALALTACGSDSLGGGGGEGALPSKSVSQDSALADRLPDKIKSSGEIVVATAPGYPPNEFLEGTTVTGVDIDLFDAVAAKLGVKAEWKQASFDTIIVGVQGGKYDLGISSFTINEKRKEQVSMVSYFSAGTQWATQPGNPEQVDIDNPCGKTIAVQNTTVQQEEDLPARQEKCADKPMKILPFDRQDQATAAVVSGRADAMLADSPVTAYGIKQSSGKIEALGDIYDAAPYGYVMNKEQADFSEVIAAALKEIEADGTYAAVLEKWGVEAGAVNDFAVNP